VWNSDRLKYEIRQRVVSSHPNSGRPPRKAAEDCDEVELKRLQQLSQKWLNYHDHVWAGDKPDTVLTRLRELPLRKRKALGALLADTESMLGRLSGAARQLQESLAKLNK
jgi:threonyl-tRNA synthetase